MTFIIFIAFNVFIRSSPSIPKESSPTSRPDTAKSDTSSKHLPRSRPSSAGSVQSDTGSKASDVSEFFGGNRVETLFKALHHEKESGAFLRKYIENVENKVSLFFIFYFNILYMYC